MFNPLELIAAMSGNMLSINCPDFHYFHAIRAFEVIHFIIFKPLTQRSSKGAEKFNEIVRAGALISVVPAMNGRCSRSSEIISAGATRVFTARKKVNRRLRISNP